MKRFFAIALALCMILCAAGCGAQDAPETTPTTEPAAPAVNAGELQPGAYAGSAEFSQDDFSMTWVFTVNFLEDGTFTLINDAAEEKGAGTWALTDTCYTMTYSDERSCTFTVLEDGSLEISGALPYGSASIEADKVGGIVLTYAGKAAAPDTENEEDTAVQGGDFTIAAGTYAASYTKESAMAGTVVYEYTAEIGEDGTFSYAVTFDMGGTVYDGSAATGTYTVEAGKFVFTDSEGNVTEGTITAENTLVISLMASQMAKEPYEVTFTNGAVSLSAGSYEASYTKESAMAGTVVYEYTAEISEDGSFSYAVTFEMNGTPYDGSAASGTYTVDGASFVFTDGEGNVTEGTITAENTLVISLMASQMAKEPYEVTFVPAA